MGGNFYWTKQEREDHVREIERRATEQMRLRDDDRKKFAEKVVMILVDQINETIIRPGPSPEERECYDMAQELHDLKTVLVSVVVAQLDVSNGVK